MEVSCIREESLDTWSSEKNGCHVPRKGYWIHDRVKNGGVMYPGGVTRYMTERKKRVSCTPKRLLDT